MLKPQRIAREWASGYACRVGPALLAAERVSRALVQFSRAAAEARSATGILEVLTDAALEHGIAEAAAVFQVGEDEHAAIVVARKLPPELLGLQVDSEELGDLGSRDLGLGQVLPLQPSPGLRCRGPGRPRMKRCARFSWFILCNYSG